MKSFLLIFIAIFGCLAGANAQKAGKIAGHVIGSNEKAIESSTVSLLRAKDSAIVTFFVSDKQGLYTFNNVADGKYLVSVTLVGHKKAYSNPFAITPEKQVVQVPVIRVTALPKSMSDVTVTTKRPPVEQKIDRTVVNVDATITNVGTNALEVLEKSPGVTVDKDGNINLKGKEGVMVMIDGRPTQLGGQDLANMLRNLNSNQLDQIEIMTNPPARYDAAGNAGVINIKTKKNSTAGYNGTASVNYMQGRYPKANESFNFNYKQGKVNVFTNVSHGKAKGFETLTIQRNLRNSNTTILENYFDQRADMIRNSNSLNGKIGMDYFANKKTTFGIVVNGFTNSNTTNNSNNTQIFTAKNDFESVTKADVRNKSNWKNFSTNLNFRRVFDSTGKELTSDFDYIAYNATNSQLLISSYFNETGNALKKADTLQGALPQNITIYSGRIDYSHPLKKGARFEAGIKSSIVSTDNNASYDSIQYGRIAHDYNRSNHFLYKENINAAYVNLNGNLSKKLSAQLGLRFENTNAKGNQITTGETFNRHYSQLFPTAYFQYKANAKNNFGLNYGRRVRRPNYESLNPFIRFIDRYTYSQGNPNLKPSVSDNIELSHTYRNYLTTTLNYSATNDIIQGVIEQKGQEAYSKQANISSLRQFGLAVSLNNAITKWWTNSIFANVYNNSFKGVVNTTPISFSATSFTLNGTQQFKLSKTLTGELSGSYRSAGVIGVMKTRPLGLLSAGFSKQLMKNKGSLRITVRDIFYTLKQSAIVNYGNVDATFQEVRDSRLVNIGFTYRFSKGKVNAQRKKPNGSAGEEQNRVGVEQ